MIRRTLFFSPLIAVALAIAHLANHSTKGVDGLGGGRNIVFNETARNDYMSDLHAAETSADPSQPGLPGETRTRKTPLEGLQVHDLAEVLRYDITPNWVYQRWPRKSTALSDLDIYGIRVPLVTGTGVDDLAGSLTYYFDKPGRLHRINFLGRTGDTRKLVDLLVRKFDFRPETPRIAGERLYQVRWNAESISELRIRSAPVIWASAPHASFEVELEMLHPDLPRYLYPPKTPRAPGFGF